MPRRRSSFEIAASILKHTTTEPLNITRILQVENLSNRETKKYLKLLLSVGLVETVPEGKFKLYRPTSKGLHFVSYVTEAAKMLQIGEGSDRSRILGQVPKIRRDGFLPG